MMPQVLECKDPSIRWQQFLNSLTILSNFNKFPLETNSSDFMSLNQVKGNQRDYCKIKLKPKQYKHQLLIDLLFRMNLKLQG